MINKGFLDALFEFIRSVESELDIMLPQSSSLQFLSKNKVTDHLITQRLGKNVIIRLLCTFDENTTETIKKLVPFIGYKSIKLSSPASSLVFIRDKLDIFSFSINALQDDKNHKHDIEDRKKGDGADVMLSISVESYAHIPIAGKLNLCS
jgi:hypothetical protein